jgi:hypothetical protein
MCACALGLNRALAEFETRANSGTFAPDFSRQVHFSENPVNSEKYSSFRSLTAVRNIRLKPYVSTFLV